jgi:hypothetical protein
MKTVVLMLFAIVALVLPTSAQVSDTLIFSGQASAWISYNFDQDFSLWAGARYIPQVNYRIEKNRHLLDAEFSANINGSIGIQPFDTLLSDGQLKPYRVWARFSGRQFEIRAGLQKINFGSATLLRPLMWFDKIDPRDPLQLSDGVWGLLGRYYFLNNANLWLWVMVPSENPKTWEFSGSNQKYPELGGRFQLPVPKGEIAFSGHWRTIDTRENLLNIPEFASVPETRFGLDGKWDLAIGLWFEASQTSVSKSLGNLTHQSLLTVGADYTFGIGNGLNLIFEHLQAASGEKAFNYSGSLAFTGISFSYPISISENLGFMTYFDWRSHNFYNFLDYKRQLKNIDLHIIVFANPKNYQMPYQASENMMLAGKGIQIMGVFNH